MKPLQDRSEQAQSTGTFGMWLFLAALSVLFGWTIGGYVYMRNLQPGWPPPDSPRLPMAGLWLSTLLIVLTSVTMEWSRRAVRAAQGRASVRWLVAAGVLGALFLANQVYNWMQVARVVIPPESKGQVFAAVFYVLTGTHAAHVVGGLILLIVVGIRAWRGRYTSIYYPGIRYSVMYWHFLDIVWLVMFLLLFLI